VAASVEVGADGTAVRPMDGPGTRRVMFVVGTGVDLTALDQGIVNVACAMSPVFLNPVVWPLAHRAPPAHR
jgi:hypothetical protein